MKAHCTRALVIILMILTGASSRTCASEEFPQKPIRIISPFAAGGANDLVARLISPALSEALKGRIFIENRAGAGGMIGTDFGARAAADGHTLTMVTTTTLATLPALRKLPYDPVKDIAPVGLVGESPYVLVPTPVSPHATSGS